MSVRRLSAFIALLVTCLLTATAAQNRRSPVADAAQSGDRATVQKLLQSKADVNAAQVDGATALHWAVYREDTQMVDSLIRAGANVKAANREGVTPLAMASLYGNPVIIDRLVKAGADAASLGPNGETMVMLAARNGNPQAIKVLVEAGANVNAREPLRGTTALMWAVEQKHPEAVKALLAAGADPSARSGGAGVPRNYMAGRVNTRVVDEARERRLRAQAAGRTYDEQFEFERQSGVPMLGQRGLGQALGPDGQPLPPAGAGRQSGAGGGAQGTGRGAAGRQGGAAAQPTQPGANPEAQQDADDNDTEVVVAGLVGGGGGGLTPLIFAAREGDIESARALLDAGANVNQQSEYGWSPLLTAVNNRNYQLATLLIDRGADVNLANKGLWTPLYLATDNRNIEGGDYPVPKADMDHLEFIRLLLEKGANPNARIKDNTLTRTIFTMQWFLEDGSTPFIRASQSGDTALMKLLLEFKADPKIATNFGDTALTAAGGIGWVPGVTYERSMKENVEAIRMLLDLGLDPNAANNDGRTALMGAAMKGRNDAVLLLVERGADLAQKDRGSRDTDKATSSAAGHRWQAIDYADGLVRVGVQSAVDYPETSALIRKLMEERGLPTPPKDRNILSVCVVLLCAGSN
jgi:ankyrin repeat protein